ncbi:MAG: thioredoxin family protein [Candidatus Zixiibacteriota bacterium]|jgi:small redox-active disulfide protein 2
MKVEVFGPGCTRCEQTFRTIMNAAAELEIPADIQYITDVATIASRGVMSTPAVIIDGEVVLVGRVPTPAKAKSLLKEHYKPEE